MTQTTTQHQTVHERTRDQAKGRVEHLLDDIYNAISDRQGLRTALAELVHADLAGGRTDGAALRAVSYDRESDGRRTEHYVDEPDGSRQLSAGEVEAGIIPDWSVTVDPDPVGDQVADTPRDQVHELAEKACGYARDAAAALWALQNTLGAFALLRDPNPNPPKVRYCPCAKWREANRPPVQRAKTTVGDRLPEPADLCSDCYEAVRRTADSGSRKGRLPVEDEVRRHDRTGRWRLTNGAAA